MADDSNGNGKRPILTRDTLVPWGAALAFAGLAYLGATKYGDLEKQIIAQGTAASIQWSEQSKEVALQIQALRFTVDAQGKDLAEVKKSVEDLTKGAQK